MEVGHTTTKASLCTLKEEFLRSILGKSIDGACVEDGAGSALVRLARSVNGFMSNARFAHIYLRSDQVQSLEPEFGGLVIEVREMGTILCSTFLPFHELHGVRPLKIENNESGWWTPTITANLTNLEEPALQLSCLDESNIDESNSMLPELEVDGVDRWINPIASLLKFWN